MPPGKFEQQTARQPTAYGISGEVTIVAPILSSGGGTAGLNLQWTREQGWAVYTYAPADVPSEGFAFGAAGQLNVANGSGPWSGDFVNVEGSLGPVGGGRFWSPGIDPSASPTNSINGYAGYNFGASIGPVPYGLGMSRTTTRYTCVVGCN